ncbi:MAG: hypothetical protein EPN23_02830 [Verrucomicrobia bacterium]|nr:MAG: hypothetical protein EPN23_02830 [Verrucomicrobiota bacterium]
MKRTNDINAKLDFWAAKPRVTTLPRLTNLPRFGHKKFNSHAELNRWKQALLAELAAHGGAQWTK